MRTYSLTGFSIPMDLKRCEAVVSSYALLGLGIRRGPRARRRLARNSDVGGEDVLHSDNGWLCWTGWDLEKSNY